MTRILADLPDEDIEKLDLLADKSKLSRAALLREVVAQYLNQHEDDLSWISRGAGYWRNRTDIGDGVEYQRALREDRRPYKDI